MTAVNRLIAILFFGTLFSCSTETQKAASPIEEEEYQPETLRDWRECDYSLDFPLDTSQLIAELYLIDHVDRTDLIENDPEKHLLSDQLDTFIMSRIAYGCICPDWFDYGCEDTTEAEGGFHFPCNYYMEPACEELIITVPFVGGDHIVKYIGKKYLQGVEDGDYGEASHAGNKFKYYSFEFIRPYSVYGPCHNDTMFSPNGGDTILQTLSTYLIVK